MEAEGKTLKDTGWEEGRWDGEAEEGRWAVDGRRGEVGWGSGGGEVGYGWDEGRWDGEAEEGGGLWMGGGEEYFTRGDKKTHSPLLLLAL